MQVKECMCNEVFCVKPETKIYEVANIMKNNHVGSVPVCDNNDNICGIVTDRDILLRAVTCDKDIKQTPISEIMTSEVCTCGCDEEITNAQSQMSQNQIRRLPVCDENNKVVGMLTLGDLAQNDNEIGKQQVSTTMNNICNCQGEPKNAY